MEVVTQSAQETKKLGEKIANNLKKKSASRRILALYGELGSGKTTFVQGLAKGLGIKERILSPTFIMIRDYAVHRTKRKEHRLYHVDLYRIEDEKDVESLGLSEILADPQNIVAIEWAEKIKKILPKKRIDVYFKYLGQDKREIKIDTVI